MKLIEEQIGGLDVVTLMTNTTLSENFTLIITDSTRTELARLKVKKGFGLLQIDGWLKFNKLTEIEKTK